MTRIFDSGASSRICRVASIPLRFGSSMSKRINSGCRARASSIASSPSLASIMVRKSILCRRIVRIVRRKGSDSSTTRSRIGGIAKQSSSKVRGSPKSPTGTQPWRVLQKHGDPFAAQEQSCDCAKNADEYHVLTILPVVHSPIGREDGGEHAKNSACKDARSVEKGIVHANVENRLCLSRSCRSGSHRTNG